jgi:lipoprotein NlpI
MNDGDYDTAIEMFEETIELEPENANAYVYL